jgi:hypothetical protein
VRRANSVAVLFGVLLAGAAHAEQPDALCAELSRFIDAAPRRGSLGVRYMSDWAGVPTVACRQDRNRIARNFCGFLASHLSIEFMSANVVRAQRCLGLQASEPLNSRMSGSDTFQLLTTKKKPVKVTLTYESEQLGSQLPFLDISVSRAN